MKKFSFYNTIILFLLVAVGANTYAQEAVAPVNFNPFVHAAAAKVKASQLSKKTALTLPFFDDFTGTGAYPDNTKWADDEVYINNTMCVSPISRGVATMDALNRNGLPYDTLSNGDFAYADSLTALPIDLSTHQPSDSLYLSFFYQPAGNGFYPLPQDSLMVYMKKKNGDWIMVWAAQGNTIKPFAQVLIPIADTNYLYDDFQFRFVNVAAFAYADAVWNIDYVRLDANRNMYDTVITNTGFTTDPTFLLNDYTYMPYRQFLVNANNERAAQYTDSIRDNGMNAQQVTYGFTARETTTNTPLYTASNNNITLQPNQPQQLTYPSYTNTTPLGNPYATVVFENKYFMQAIPGEPTDNDTIVKQQIFDNYVAYDDGTAEKSYYLNLFSSLPGYIEVEYHLNQPDTMRGMAIYFGRQVPLARQKFFSIAIYSGLAGVDGAVTDNLLYQQDIYTPAYVDEVNHFWVYTFDSAVALPAGTFFAGTIQPANSGSDSLYIGLDVNRVGGNHAYYNVLNQWEPSQISGALMMRPMLGPYVFATGIDNTTVTTNWTVSPNPATNYLKFNLSNNNKTTACIITDITGRTVAKQNIQTGNTVDISMLKPGMYFVNLSFDGVLSTPQKIVKQ